MRRFAFGREVPSLRGDRGESAYTGQNPFCPFYSHLFYVFSFFLMLAPFVSSADTFPDKRGQLTSCILFFLTQQVIHFKNYDFFFLSRLLPPNTEGSAEPCGAIGASLRTQGKIFNSCILCQILTAPVGRVWHFTHFYSVAPLLEKWFTCHHFVRE